MFAILGDAIEWIILVRRGDWTRVRAIDLHILLFLNSFAHRWLLLDSIVALLQGSDLARGCPVMALYCYAWFQSGETANTAEIIRKRQTLLYAVLMCVPGLLLTRILTSTLPFRERPIENSQIHLHLAYHFDPSSFLGWSSFPSDHAVLFFALATGMYLVSRKLGLLLYAHAIFVITLPRVFLGIHYPSDILGGALLGIALIYPAKWPSVPAAVTRPVFEIQERSPGIFYVCFLFLLYETAGLYWNLIQILMLVSHSAKTFLHNINR